MRFILLVIVVCAGLGAAAYLYGYVLFKPSMIMACDEAMKDRLKAPSTYRRLSASELKQPLTFEQFYAARSESEVVKKFIISSAKETPIRHVVILEYEAANSFGTPLRSKILCTHDTLNNKVVEVGKGDVMIDGKTNLDWMLEQVTGMKQKRP